MKPGIDGISVGYSAKAAPVSITPSTHSYKERHLCLVLEHSNRGMGPSVTKTANGIDKRKRVMEIVGE
jgi:hypothetical protein